MLNISQSADDFNFILLVSELIQPVCKLLILIRIKMRVCVESGLYGFMTGPIRNFQSGEPKLYEHTCVGVPLRYNYDKPEKPCRIKGFEVFSLVFSSFSKPKNHTEISRIIGGVSLTTNE